MILCAGSYASSADENSINFYEVNEKTGKLKYLGGGAKGKCSSYLAFGDRYIYAADDCETKGHIDSYEWDGKGGLKFKGGCDLPGSVMCHVALIPGEKFIAGANYIDGSVVICALDENGIPAGTADIDRHEGVGFNTAGRQDKPYVHFACPTPDGNRLIVNDLGLDWSAVYLMDKDTGKLTLDAEENQVHTPGGQGPRHLTFSPDGRFWYLLTEMGCRIFAYAYDKISGKSTFIKSLPMLPEGFDGFNIASDIHFSPDGRFLYAMNRGRNEVVCYKVDSETGDFELSGRYDAYADMSRSLSVSENFLATAGQLNGKVTVIYRNPITGELGDIADRVDLKDPAFVCFI